MKNNDDSASKEPFCKKCGETTRARRIIPTHSAEGELVSDTGTIWAFCGGCRAEGPKIEYRAQDGERGFREAMERAMAEWDSVGYRDPADRSKWKITVLDQYENREGRECFFVSWMGPCEMLSRRE